VMNTLRPVRTRLLAGLLCLAPLFAASTLTGCSMPRVMGMGSYYAVTDVATGTVYYTSSVSREDRGSVEFLDPATGAWVSLAAAQVREISAAEFRAGAPR